MSIDEVLTQIRLYIWRHPEPYTQWADAIRAEIEEKARLNEQLDLFAREARTNHNGWSAVVRERDAEIERLQRLLMRSTDDGQRLLDAVAKLLSCPAIAGEDFSDPEWGCAETREAESFARAVLAEANHE
jgi:predicted RNase H-like nuclease (RuvC/YqgF family)